MANRYSAYEALRDGINRIRAERGLPPLPPRPMPNRERWRTAAEILAEHDSRTPAAQGNDGDKSLQQVAGAPLSATLGVARDRPGVPDSVDEDNAEIRRSFQGDPPNHDPTKKGRT